MGYENPLLPGTSRTRCRGENRTHNTPRRVDMDDNDLIEQRRADQRRQPGRWFWWVVAAALLGLLLYSVIRAAAH